MVAGALPNADLFLSIFIHEQKLIVEKMRSIAKLRQCFMAHQTPIQRLMTLSIVIIYDHTQSKESLTHDINEVLKNLLKTIEDKETLKDVTVLCTVLSNKLNPFVTSRNLNPPLSSFLDQVTAFMGEGEEVEFCIKRAELINELLKEAVEDLVAVATWRVTPRKQDISLHVEKQELIKTLEDAQKALDNALECFTLLRDHLGIDVTEKKWREAVDLIAGAGDEFSRYLYLNQLLLECINVSAVSERNILIAENFLQ